MELKDTIEMMTSPDYKERFKAEYYQLKIRREKLMNIVLHWNSLSFTPTCDKKMYRKQLKYMSKLMEVLEERSLLEGIRL